MARTLSWTDVRGGLIALVVILALAGGILRFGRVGALHGDTFPLTALVGEARGLSSGSEVWLSGQKVGKVTKIQFLPPQTADTARRIRIDMEVLSRYREALHQDAIAQIRSGGSVIGPVVVYLSPGSPWAAVIREGDTVLTHPQADVEAATGQFAGATQEFPAIMDNVKHLAAQLRGTEGTMGAILHGPGLGELARTRRRMSELTLRLDGNGTVGRALRGGLPARAGRVMARVDSVRALLASSNSSFGRFRKDSTLMAEVADIRRELTELQSALDEPRGTAGRVLRDSALTNAVADAKREMTLLSADIKKRPLRYISF